MSEITFVSTSFYPDPWDKQATRLHLLLELVGSACGYGYKTLVVDGSPEGSRDYVGDCLLRAGAIVAPQLEPGMRFSREQAFALAVRLTNSPHICWTEEKPHIVLSARAMIQQMREQSLDVGVMRRNPEMMEATYPPFQTQSERQANAVLAECIGFDLDLMSGPVVFTRGALRSTGTDAETYGVSAYAAGYAQHFRVLEAIARGLKVGSLPVDFAYPSEQRWEEERALATEMQQKRKDQLEDLAAGYRAAAKWLGLPKAT